MQNANNQISHRTDDSVESPPRGNFFVHTLAMIWLVGVIFLDKQMAYVRIGPIYITEFLLASLILTNIRILKKRDVFLFSVLAFYFVGALIKGRDPFFAIRDLAWLYYLLFLRFFPRDFPKKYINIVLLACGIRVIVTISGPILSNELAGLLLQKYRDMAVILFLAGYFSLYKKDGNLGIGNAVFLAVVSFFSDYKSLMVVMFILPFALQIRTHIAKWHSPRRIFALALVSLFLIYNKAATDIMTASVESLNASFAAIGINKRYDTGTAVWRAEIWQKALLTLSTWADILFGEFPGHNFMDSKFLGLKHFHLEGGDRLGVLRSAHNIIVQIFMKTGLFGFLTYGWYYFKCIRKDSHVLSVLYIGALLMAMTADIFEVPSRGPLLFSLFVILEIMFDELSRLNEQQMVTSSVLNDLDLVQTKVHPTDITPLRKSIEGA